MINSKKTKIWYGRDYNPDLWDRELNGGEAELMGHDVWIVKLDR